MTETFRPAEAGRNVSVDRADKTKNYFTPPGFGLGDYIFGFYPETAIYVCTLPFR